MAENRYELNDEELSEVSGGMREEGDLPTKGKNIICPVCEKGDGIEKKALYDPILRSVQYECKCGAKFVYYGNSVIMYEAFKKKLEEKNYFNYKF